MPASTASPEIRAAALADLVAGEQPAVVADRYGLNPATVRSWRRRLDDATPNATLNATHATHATHATAAAPITHPTVEARKQAIAEIVLDLLATKLEGARRLAAHLSDPAFLAGQKVDDLLRISDYLDRSALALGDRLAGAVERQPDGDDRAP